MKSLVFLCALLLVPSYCAWADATAEIEHLLGFIGSSGCTFVRNDEKHKAKAAQNHIEMKYDYAKRSIRTAEQFIEHTATKSSTSGEPYRVICAGREEASAEWLGWVREQVSPTGAACTQPKEG